MNTFNLLHGDCLDQLKTLPDNSIDAIVTDPPYGLSKQPDMSEVLRHWMAGDDYVHNGSGFMGKSWDSFVPGPSVWKECLRVLKPGGHLLAFFGSRTYDIGTLAVRLAGFEVRDQIMWVYGSGFPKSLDVSKAIDKAAGAEREVVGSKITGKARTKEGWAGGQIEVDCTAPATPEAAQWDGWGTALKPAHEPIVLARKPLVGTVAKNTLEHGCGGLNIDGCRVGEGAMKWSAPRGGIWATDPKAKAAFVQNDKGRFPANLIHDGSPEVLALFPQAPGQQGDLKGHNKERQSPNGCFGKMAPARDHAARIETDKSAARFFKQIDTEDAEFGEAACRFKYCAKASKKDRNEGCENLTDKQWATDGACVPERANRPFEPSKNNHPTVKPTALMQYLCRLITPPGGTVLDPFTGSGSTGKAAMLEGFDFIGIEREAEYLEIARARITHAAAQEPEPAVEEDQMDLLAEGIK